MLDQGCSGGGLENGKPERRAGHATERSAVECEDRERRLPIFAAPGDQFMRPWWWRVTADRLGTV